RRSPASASLHARAGPGGPARKGRPRYRSVPPTASGPAADVPVVRETGGAAAARMRPGCPGGSEIDDDHAARGRFLFALFPRLLPGSVGDRDGDFQHRALALDAPFGLFLLLSLHPIDDESIEHGHVLLPSLRAGGFDLSPPRHLHLGCQGAEGVALVEHPWPRPSAPTVRSLSAAAHPMQPSRRLRSSRKRRKEVKNGPGSRENARLAACSPPLSTYTRSGLTARGRKMIARSLSVFLFSVLLAACKQSPPATEAKKAEEPPAKATQTAAADPAGADASTASAPGKSDPACIGPIG